MRTWHYSQKESERAHAGYHQIIEVKNARRDERKMKLSCGADEEKKRGTGLAYSTSLFVSYNQPMTMVLDWIFLLGYVACL
jgi:hypothetical protein